MPLTAYKIHHMKSKRLGPYYAACKAVIYVVTGNARGLQYGL
jgi:hypothetical protein